MSKVRLYQRVAGGAETFFSPVAVLTLAVAIGGLLYFMLPKQSAFLQSDQVKKPDALSAEYLKLLIKSDPKNLQLRFALAQQLSAQGKVNEALSHLKPLIHSPAFRGNPEVWQTYLQALAQKMYAQPTDKARAQVRAELKAATLQMLHQSLPAQAREALLSMALRWLYPPEQIEVLSAALQTAYSPARQYVLHLKLSQLYIAEGQYAAAQRHLDAAYTLAPEKDKPLLAIKQLKLLLASGQPRKALQKARAYVQAFPNYVPLLKLAVQIAQQNNQLALASRWSKQLVKAGLGSEAQYWDLLKLEIAAGDLKSALALLPKLKPSATTPERMLLVAQVYTWTNHPRRALPWWIKLAQATHREKYYKVAWGLAIGTGRLEEARRILEALAKRRALRADERTELYNIYIAQGDTQAAEKLLRSAYAQQPNDIGLQKALYKLLVDTRQWKKAIDLLEQARQHGRLLPGQYIELANILWLTRQPERAHDTLLKAPPAARNAAYWALRSKLALYLELFPDAAYALRMYYQLPEAQNAPLETQAVIDAATGLALLQRYKEAATLVHEIACSEGNISGCQKAIELALAGKQYQLAQQWLKVLPMPNTRAERALYWYQWGVLFRGLSQPEKAIQAWWRATINMPNVRTYRDELGWYLVAQADVYPEALKKFLTHIAPQAAEDASVLPFLAYGHLVLGEHAAALRWFRAGLELHRHQLDWLLGLAEAYQQQGYEAYAFRLRRHVWQQLKRRIAIPGARREDLNNASRLVASLFGARVAQAWLASPAAQKLSEDQKISLLLEQAFLEGSQVLADFYAQQAYLHHIELAGWQKLALALQKNDADAMEAILAHYKRLPKTDEVLVLHKLGYRTRALEKGISTLSPDLNETDLRQVRRLTASLRSQLEQGVRIVGEYQRRDVLDVDTLALTAAWLRPNAQWRVDLAHYEPNSSVIVPRALDPQQSLSVAWRKLRRASEQKITGWFDQRSQKSTFGVGLGVSGTWSEAFAYEASLHWHKRPDLSGTLWGWGLENAAQGQLTYGIDSRTVLTTTLGWRQMESVWEVKLGEGPYANMALTHVLFSEDPTWQLGLTASAYSLSGQPLRDPRLNALFKVTPAADTVFPREFGRIGISSSWFHGQVHRIAHAVPSPRWHVVLNSGYQWVRDVVDYGVDVGMGWRVFGDDELALSLGWQSETAAGGASMKLRASYNQYFGR